jgi:chromosome partitioning protein
VATDNLVGIAEVADLAGVTKQAVSNWRLRYDHFPRPIQNLQSGPVWDREQVSDWVKGFRGEETHVLSFINLKGGVGKTTTAVAVAEMLAQEQRKHVLLIDLDPQTNATVTLISEEKWAEMDKDGRTIAQLFEDRLNPQNAPKFDIEKAIARRVSTINDGIARLDLLPSSIRLIDLQDRIPMIALSENFTANPLEILRSALQPVIDRYDYIIIDCPPAVDSLAPQSALLIADLAVVPVIPSPPDLWASVGITKLIEHARTINEELQAVIVLNQCQPQQVLTKDAIEILKDFQVPLAKGYLGDRAVYRQSSLYGQTVHDMGSRAEAAIREITDLTEEFLGILGQSRIETEEQ